MARHVARPFTAPPEPTGGRTPDPFAATGPALRWGVVSTGKIAHTVTAQLARLEDARLQAVSSRDATKAAAFATQYGFRASYGGAGGYEAVAEDPDVDVVYVATPHGQHHAVAGAMLRAGKHVLVEKAFTITAREAEDLARLARDHGLFLMEAVWTRFLPTYVAAMDVLEGGEIGPVRYVQADMGFMAERDPRTRLWAPVDGGGALLDLAVYPLCWVIGALGLPTGVQAAGNVNHEGVDELCTLALTHGGGAHSQVVVSFVSDSTRRARIVGTEGYLETGPSLSRPDGFTVVKGAARRSEGFDLTDSPYAFQLREVTRCVQAGMLESPAMPLAHTLATMRLFDEVRRQIGVRYPNDDAAR